MAFESLENKTFSELRKLNRQKISENKIEGDLISWCSSIVVDTEIEKSQDLEINRKEAPKKERL
jgi:hypothetical protein